MDQLFSRLNDSCGDFLFCSAGICFVSGEGFDYQKALKCADTALYESKKKGKRRYSYYEKMEDMKSERKKPCEIRMNGCTGFFQVFFQPAAFSFFLMIGRIRPRAVSTKGVITFKAVDAGSPSTYIPKIQQNAVTTKHQMPAVRAMPDFLQNGIPDGICLLPCAERCRLRIPTGNAEAW